MAGFLDDYGVADARRSKVIRWIVISALVITVAAVTLYFVLRTYPARRHVDAFLSDLGRHDYRAAYRDWGCVGARCSDYPFEKFMQDWGPQSGFANASAARVKKTSFCDTGVIVTVTDPKGGTLALWYQRSDQTLSYAPWPVCAPRIPAPQGAPSP
jgi:hypothetical protein